MTASRSRSIEDHRAALLSLVAPSASLMRQLADSRDGEPIVGREELALSAVLLAGGSTEYRHRVLCEDVLSPTDLPRFDNSQMDGFAVRREDLAGAGPASPVTLPSAPRVAAGDAAGSIPPGRVVPVMTGSRLPEGTDAVVPIEEVEPDSFGAEDGTEHPITFRAQPEAGRYLRRAGSDLNRGAVLLKRGTVLGPAQYGVLAAAGFTSVIVRRKPRILLISTGHEIREPGTVLAESQIHDANSSSLAAALVAVGAAVQVVACRSDDAAELDAILDLEGADADLAVTIGGVSKGSREVVRDALGPRGVEFHSVAMQPGGPQGLGSVRVGGRGAPLPVICVPGNPVSALISFEVFVRPAIRLLLGSTESEPERHRARLATATHTPAGKVQLRRAVLDPQGRIAFQGGPGSHLLHAYAQSRILVRLEPRDEGYAAGDEVDYWRIDG